MLLNFEKYEISPDADTLVFVHGAGGSIQTWTRQVAYFRNHFNLIVLDLRDHGHSKSDKPLSVRYSFELVANDIIVLLDHLHLKNVHFMGVSVGSVIIRKVHEMRPDLVKSMLFSGGMFKMDYKISFLLRSGYLLHKVLPYRAVYTLFAFLLIPRANHKIARKIFIRESIKIKQNEFNKWMVLCKDIRKVLRIYFNEPIKIPCLSVMGSQDHVFLRPAIEYKKKHETIEVKILEKCGHVCNLEKAKLFNDTVLAFLHKHFGVAQFAKKLD